PLREGVMCDEGQRPRPSSAREPVATIQGLATSMRVAAPFHNGVLLARLPRVLAAGRAPSVIGDEMIASGHPDLWERPGVDHGSGRNDSFLLQEVRGDRIRLVGGE